MVCGIPTATVYIQHILNQKCNVNINNINLMLKSNCPGIWGNIEVAVGNPFEIQYLTGYSRTNEIKNTVM